MRKQFWAIDGGIVTTNDEQIYKSLNNFRERKLRKNIVHDLSVLTRFVGNYGTSAFSNYGFRRSLKPFARPAGRVGRIEMPGDFVSTFCGIQAAVCLAQLGKVDYILERQRKLAALYTSELKSCEKIRLPVFEREDCPCYYTIRVDNRDEFYERLARAGIETSRLFNYSTPDTEPFVQLRDNGSYINTREAAKSILNLPLYPSLSEDEVKGICTNVVRIAGVLNHENN